MMAVTETSNRSKKIHPHKFLMWMGIGSICMMFAGLTSAYIVKRNQANWEDVQLSPVFLYSTMVIVSSSITMYLALKAFKARQMLQYKNLITITVILGLVFAYLQYIGFKAMANHGVLLIGTGSNAAASFLIVIIGLHVLHVLGGVVALLITFIMHGPENQISTGQCNPEMDICQCIVHVTTIHFREPVVNTCKHTKHRSHAHY